MSFVPRKPDLALKNLPLLKRKSLLFGMHCLSFSLFKASGFNLELRRSGELKLGYWKKKLRPRNQKHPFPKRLVVLPGFGDTPLSWHPIFCLLQPWLKREFDELILFDFPGFGGTLCQEKVFPNLNLMMTVVDDALDDLRPDTLVGHSLGGWIAAHYASLCGEKKRPIIHGKNYQGPSQILFINPTALLESSPHHKNWNTLLENSVQEGYGALKPHLFAKPSRWLKMIEPFFKDFIKREDVVHFVQSICMSTDAYIALQKIKTPVWLLWGEKDQVVSESSRWEWMKQLYGGSSEAKAVILQGLGHNPHLEKPGVTALVLGQILLNRKPHPYGERWWRVISAPEQK